MKYPSLKMTLAALAAGLFSMPAQSQVEMLSGDAKLSCEALLCLSTGVRPGECGPSLSRYFGIKKKKASDTNKARRNFLKICPTTNENPTMAALADTIVNAAGNCEPEVLNQTLARQVTRVSCGSSYTYYDDPRGRFSSSPPTPPEGLECVSTSITVIDNTKPSYCTAYELNQYTYQVGGIYVGAPLSGGHWENSQ